MTDFSPERIIDPGSELLAPGTAARLLGVTTRTLTRLADSGKLHPILTAGGQRRYLRAEIEQLRTPA